jgi:hypothetical protein
LVCEPGSFAVSVDGNAVAHAGGMHGVEWHLTFRVGFPTLNARQRLDLELKERLLTTVRLRSCVMTPDYADALLKLGTIGSFTILTIFGGAAALIAWSILF